MTRMAVIGAGAGGLCAAKHLLARGVDVTVFEAGSQVGGLWVYENDNGRSPAYASLHINSEAAVTSYEDFPFPHGSSLFPRHTEVHAYLESYADHFGVRPHIRFRSVVESVTPADGHRWSVRLEGGAEEVFDGVVVAPGHQARPSHPSVADDFGGDYVHVHDYRTPEPFRDKRVLIIGMGNSALDAAADMCTGTASTTLVARSPVLILPRLLFGVPSARVLGRLERPWVPWPVRRRLRMLIAAVAHGSMEKWGLVTARTRTHPTSHPTLMTHAAYGRVRFRPAIASVDGRTVGFADGRTEEFDVMIGATGYEVDLPFLSPDVVTVHERRPELYKRIFAPGRPGLYFVGYFNVSGGANIRMMDTQARAVAAVACGDVRLPDVGDMLSDLERERALLRKRYPNTPRYGLELDPADYRSQIDELLHTGSPQS